MCEKDVTHQTPQCWKLQIFHHACPSHVLDSVCVLASDIHVFLKQQSLYMAVLSNVNVVVSDLDNNEGSSLL